MLCPLRSAGSGSSGNECRKQLRRLRLDVPLVLPFDHSFLTSCVRNGEMPETLIGAVDLLVLWILKYR